MRPNDLGIDEADILTSVSDRRSIDPDPGRTMGMDPRILRDMVSDHIRSLRNINRSLPRSPGLDDALSKLEDEYYRLFGQRLTELLSSPDSQVKAAVLELRRKLQGLVKSDGPDLSYRNINRIMQSICDEFLCAPRSLHDQFVATFYKTPDEWAREHSK